MPSPEGEVADLIVEKLASALGREAQFRALVRTHWPEFLTAAQTGGIIRLAGPETGTPFVHLPDWSGSSAGVRFRLPQILPDDLSDYVSAWQLPEGLGRTRGAQGPCGADFTREGPYWLRLRIVLADIGRRAASDRSRAYLEYLLRPAAVDGWKAGSHLPPLDSQFRDAPTPPVRDALAAVAERTFGTAGRITASQRTALSAFGDDLERRLTSLAEAMRLPDDIVESDSILRDWK